MTTNFEQMKKWRKRTTDAMEYIMGAECCVCGYNKTTWALHYHHIDPSKKVFNLSKVRSDSIPWEDIENELRKCVVLCANCHAEVHAGLITPTFVSSFSEERLAELCTRCKNCGTLIHHKGYFFCNHSCRSKHSAKVAEERKLQREEESVWSKISAVELLYKHNGNVLKASKEVGLSDNAVRKRLKKETGFFKWKEYQQSLIVCRLTVGL